MTTFRLPPSSVWCDSHFRHVRSCGESALVKATIELVKLAASRLPEVRGLRGGARAERLLVMGSLCCRIDGADLSDILRASGA